jgi:opacity protein-like surface antigen
MKYRENAKMIRFAAATIALVVLTGSFVFAQDAMPKVQVFGGFSLINESSGGLTQTKLNEDLHQTYVSFGIGTDFKGWDTEAQYNATRWIGVVADFGGRYGTPFTPALSTVSGVPDANRYSLLAGPVLTYRSKSKITPFGHVLVGFDRATLDASTITTPTGTVTSLATTYTDVAVAFGGGFDYKLSRHFALRPGQFDLLYTTHNLDKVYTDAFGPGLFEGLRTHQNNLRFSTGLVVRF